MRMTIKEIARLSGVSQSTVSKIINNYDDVGSETKNKVLQIMKEHGYRPSYSAQSLAKKVTHVIGVIYAGRVNADFNHPFFVDVLNAFKNSVGRLGYDLMFFSNEHFHEGDEDFLERCRHYNVDGCIIIGGETIQPSVYALDQSEIPCVGIDLTLRGKNSTYLMTDNDEMLAKVIEHFYLEGHRDIGFIGGQKPSTIARLRLDAFHSAMRSYQLHVNEDWIYEGDFFEQSGYEAMRSFLQQETVPSAIFAASDLMAIGALRALKEAGVPLRSYSIIGCDDIDAAQYVDPSLTTIRQNKEKIGQLASRLLKDLIDENMHGVERLVEPELVIRASSNPVEN
ncbi:transcriptional regulator, LacI family [Geomicrobium sp. JCM 19037]|uniref:LacI family DNA-binding transcriptional regulator n=1 Tax=unclassified Geomicrobium TaxID=2628951 RepID=UPI00045F3486|nr:LacI family DNA-binding transcriptional regulator [Geomicrobium sp. JCM 19037]GAK05054.1 transcriptional regulator, LacI family [Geomicrobium sp. JCM 19037]